MATFKNIGKDLALTTAIRDMQGTNDADNTQSTSTVAANVDGSMVERLEYLQNSAGTNDSNNTISTSSVVADRDGSLFERTEFLMGGATAVSTPSTFVPGLGYRITKSEDMTAATGVDLFTVTGKILVTLWSGEVTVAITTNVADYKLRVKTDNVDLCAAAVLTSAAAGFMWQLNNDAGDTILQMGSYAVSAVKTADGNGKPMGGRIVGLASGSLILQSLRTASGAGTMVHTMFYLPLEASATVA